MRLIHYKYNQKGFSLIELMVVVVILGMIILGLVSFFTGGTRSWIAGQSQLKAQREARQVMDRMVREIREGESIDSILSNQTSVTVNYLDSFGKTPVTFSLSGSTVIRGGAPLIENVQTFEVSYTGASKVHILLEIDVDDDGRPDITLNSDVNLRNYGLSP